MFKFGFIFYWIGIYLYFMCEIKICLVVSKIFASKIFEAALGLPENSKFQVIWKIQIIFYQPFYNYIRHHQS